MGVAGQNFLGRNYYLPGARFAFRSRSRPPSLSDDLSTMKIIGPADNGKYCNDPALEDEGFYSFHDLATARRILGRGKLLDAIKLAFSPSTRAGFEQGPQTIKAFNVNPNTSAARKLSLQTKSASPFFLAGTSTKAPTINDNFIASLDRISDPVFPLTQSFDLEQDAYIIFAFDKEGIGSISALSKNNSSVLSDFALSAYAYHGRKLSLLISKSKVAKENAAITYSLSNTPAEPTKAGLQAQVPGPAGNQIGLRKNADKTIELRAKNLSERSPKLEWPAFALAYTGSAGEVHLSIDTEQITIVEESTTHSALLSELETLAGLLGWLASLPGFAAEPLTDSSFALGKLDYVHQATLTSQMTTFYADSEAEKLYLEGSGLVFYTIPAAHRRPLARSARFTYLAGGQTGTPESEAYSQAITQAEKTGGLFCNLLSTAQADKICFRDSMIKLNSPDAGKECLGGVGAGRWALGAGTASATGGRRQGRLPAAMWSMA